MHTPTVRETAITREGCKIATHKSQRALVEASVKALDTIARQGKGHNAHQDRFGHCKRP